MHVKLNDAHTHGKTANYFNCLSRHYSLFKCAQHERERVCALCVYCVCTVGVCAVCVCTVCVCAVCVCVCLCVGQPARHTQAAVYTDMKLLPNDIIISPSLSHLHSLPALPYPPSHSLFFIISVSFLLPASLSVSLSHLISENKY